MKRPVSAQVAARLRNAGIPFAANDSIAEYVSTAEVQAIEHEVRNHMGAVLDALVIDRENDHNTKGTAARIAKMFVREMFSGRYQPPPTLTEFPNAKRLDELYTLGPIAVRSACSHHFCPIEGSLFVGVVPNGKVLGISKFTRLARHVFARPQIQEEAIVQMADALAAALEPQGLAVVVTARHSCMTWRGVQEHATVMTNSVMRGLMKHSPATRAEFFKLIEQRGFTCQT